MYRFEAGHGSLVIEERIRQIAVQLAFLAAHVPATTTGPEEPGVMHLLAFDKETLMIGAFASMIVAGVVVTIGAIVLFLRERRAER